MDDTVICRKCHLLYSIGKFPEKCPDCGCPTKYNKTTMSPEELMNLVRERVHNSTTRLTQVESKTQTALNLEIHKHFCEKCHEIYTTKNHDYGSSFAELRKRLPNAILVRLFDKYMRLETLLLKGETNAKIDESVDDTLTDLANYALMELTERQLDTKGAK